MRKHTTHWQSMLIGIIFLLICTITTNIASATTVLLEMTDKNNAPLTSGSGFFISDTLIVTNADAIKDAVTGTAQVVGKNKKHTIKAVAAVDPKTGLVLLRVLPSGVAPLPLGDSDIIKIGDTVVIPSNALAALVKQTEQSEQGHDPIGNISAGYFNKSGLAQAQLGDYQKPSLIIRRQSVTILIMRKHTTIAGLRNENSDNTWIHFQIIMPPSN